MFSESTLEKTPPNRLQRLGLVEILICLIQTAGIFILVQSI